MDILNILIDPDKTKDICCLCYKKNENTTGLHDCIEIHDEFFNFNSTLWNLMKHLFPSHDILLPNMCEDCSTLIIKIFGLLQRSNIKSELVNYFIDNLNEEADEMDCKLIFNPKLKKCRLKINIPTTNSIKDTRTSTKFNCDKCPMAFKSKLLLKKHIQISHKDTNNAVICDICGKIFTKNALLKAHLGCHKQKQCPYCFKLLKSHSHFNIHLKSHKSNTRIKRNAKYYNCSHCDYRSLNKCTLEAHINKIHLHIKPFTCEICRRGFYKKDNLTQHLATHNKIKNKTCYVCGDVFHFEKTLQEHLKLHTGEKPFICGVCNAGFITAGRRQEHIKRKHMEKNECCIICDKKFSLKKDLNTHLKKVHGAETNNFLLKIDPDNQSSFEVVKVINYKK